MAPNASDQHASAADDSEVPARFRLSPSKLPLFGPGPE